MFRDGILPREIEIIIASYLSNKELRAVALTNRYGLQLTDSISWKAKIIKEFRLNVPENIDPKTYYFFLMKKLNEEKKRLLEYVATLYSIAVKLTEEQEFLSNFSKELVVSSNYPFACIYPENDGVKIQNLYNLTFAADVFAFLKRYIDEENEETTVQFFRAIINQIYKSGIQARYSAAELNDEEQKKDLIFLLKALCHCGAELTVRFFSQQIFSVVKKLPIETLHNLLIYACLTHNLPLVDVLLKAETPVNQHDCIPGADDYILVVCPIHAVFLN